MANEYERIRASVETDMRRRLESRKPDPRNFFNVGTGVSRIIPNILDWSRVFVPVIAILASIASGVRTVQTSAEIYSASGSAPVAVVLAAVVFTLAVEGSLFLMALAQERMHLQWRTEGRMRSVSSLKRLWLAAQVRLGMREPLRYDEIPERDGLASVIGIAFAFAVVSNLYLGLRPLWLKLSTEQSVSSLQVFIGNLWNAPADIQMTFIVDMAAVLFPPFMALKAGHLTAKFAAETAQRQHSLQNAFDTAMETWLKEYNNPLETTEGRELYDFRTTEYERAKTMRVESPQPVRSLPSGTKRTRNNNAPVLARQLLTENPDWTPGDLMRAGVTKSTAYKVYAEVHREA